VTKERFGSLMLLLIGIYSLVSSLQLPVGNWGQPGPGLFPLILSILLCAVAILLLISEQGKTKLDWHARTMTPWKIVLLTAGFIFFMKTFGYLATSFLYLFGLLFWVSRMKIWVSIGLSLILTPATWYFFGSFLGLQLPVGPWRF
jgi:putative tricarboxylic transport membrane protein